MKPPTSNCLRNMEPNKIDQLVKRKVIWTKVVQFWAEPNVSFPGVYQLLFIVISGWWNPWKSKTKQRMVFRMIDVTDSLLPRGKVWSLDFLGNDFDGTPTWINQLLGRVLGNPRLAHRPTSRFTQIPCFFRSCLVTFLGNLALLSLPPSIVSDTPAKTPENFPKKKGC